MDWLALAKRIDADAARAFVQAARQVIDALLLEAERPREMQPPAARDYNTAELPRQGPPGGWVSHQELRATARRMAEAMAAEKWTDGFIAALRLLSAVGGRL